MGNELQLGIRQYLANVNVEKRFRDMLGDRAPAFISSIISAVSMNSTLQKAYPESVVSAAAVAASLDLPINPSLGMAYIVPYQGKAQFQLGWKGFIQLAIRSGQYRSINISDIYEGDIKSINRFTGSMEFNNDQIANYTSRPVVGYLLYFCLITGYEKYFYMSVDECKKHAQKYSESYRKGKGQWVDDFDSMGRKTVAKIGLSKYGILSVEMQRAVITDQAVIDDDGNAVEYPDNDSGHTPQITDVVKAEQTLRQQYETLKLQMQQSGNGEILAGFISSHEGISGHNEKTWDDNDLEFLNKSMMAELGIK